jgi:AcrR family transcriptional regulator
MEPIAAAESASFVPRTERERLLLSFAELAMAHGIENVTLEHLAKESGVGLDVVHGYFADEEDCALVMGDVAAEQLFSAVGRAFVSTAGDCPLAARAALDAMLRFFAGSPAVVHLAVVEYGRLSVRAAEARHRGMDSLAAFLGPGFAVAGDLVSSPETLSRLIAGGIYELVSRYYLEGRLHDLPEASPAVAYFTVAPFFGLEEAQRVASTGPRV